MREELRGTFFTMRLADARASLRACRGCAASCCAARGRDRLEMTVSEHEPLARWNDSALVNVQGEVFVADYDGDLPQFTGPDGTAAEMTRSAFAEFGARRSSRRAGDRRDSPVARAAAGS